MNVYFDLNIFDRIEKKEKLSKSENKIYEVKSVYTYNNDLEKNLAKEAAVKKMGIGFEFMIL